MGRCFGVTLWKGSGRGKHVELWFCFEGVKEHRHPGQGVEVIPLFGWARFFRSYPDGAQAGGNQAECVEIGRKTWGRAFTVPAGWPHWFTLTGGGSYPDGAMRWPLVFLNVTDDGRSAAENFDMDCTNCHE